MTSQEWLEIQEFHFVGQYDMSEKISLSPKGKISVSHGEETSGNFFPSGMSR